MSIYFWKRYRQTVKNYLKSSHYVKLRVQPLLFFFLFFSFPCPRSFFFSFPFPSLVWFWSLSGPKSLPFDAFSFKWLQISLGWFSKKSNGFQKIFVVQVILFFHKKFFYPDKMLPQSLLRTKSNTVSKKTQGEHLCNYNKFTNDSIP